MDTNYSTCCDMPVDKIDGIAGATFHHICRSCGRPCGVNSQWSSSNKEALEWLELQEERWMNEQINQ